MQHSTKKSITQDVVIRYFLGSAIAVLFITSLFKVVSIMVGGKILDVVDPLFSLKNRHVLLFVSLVEIAIASVIVSSRFTTFIKLSVLSWFCFGVLSYRLGIYFVDAPTPCPCLGSLGDWIPSIKDAITPIMWGILSYLIIGSYGCLGWKMIAQYNVAEKQA